MESSTRPTRCATDITFIIGPPGPDQDKQKFEEWSKSSGRPAGEIWVEYVHDVLGQLASRKSDGSVSDLDEMVSRAVGTSVRIDEPFLTSTFFNGARCPAIMLYVNKISGPNGAHPTIDWAEPAVKQLIGSIFGMLFKSEWVRTLVAYG